MGLGEKSHQVHLIGFSMAKGLVSESGVHFQAGEHLAYREGKAFIGNPRFASLNNHLGIELSRRDDLISFCYLLVFFLKGSLPWDSLLGKSTRELEFLRQFDTKYSTMPE